MRSAVVAVAVLFLAGCATTAPSPADDSAADVLAALREDVAAVAPASTAWTATPAASPIRTTPSPPPVERLTVPMPESPSNGADHLDARAVTLAWSPSTSSFGASVSYVVWSNGRVVCETDDFVCTLPVTGGTEYSWWVVARGATVSAMSAIGNFRTNAAPTAPRPDVGDDGADQVPLDLVYSWNPSVDPDGDRVRYDVRYREVGQSGSRIACEAIETTTCVFPERLTAGTRYQIEVEARDEFGGAAMSSISFTTKRPIVVIHGWRGDAGAVATLAGQLRSAGNDVIVVGYAPTAEAPIIELIARDLVQPKVDELLGPRKEFDVVAHSMGGLIARTLIEHPEIGMPWRDRVRTLVMVGTPNEGVSWVGGGLCDDESDWWGYTRCQMAGRGDFYETMNPALPGPVSYYTIAGSWNGGPDDGLVTLESVSVMAARENLILADHCHSTSRPGCKGDAALMESPRVGFEVARMLAG